MHVSIISISHVKKVAISEKGNVYKVLKNIFDFLKITDHMIQSMIYRVIT